MGVGMPKEVGVGVDRGVGVARNRLVSREEELILEEEVVVVDEVVEVGVDEDEVGLMLAHPPLKRHKSLSWVVSFPVPL